MLQLVLAVALATALAWWSWRDRWHDRRARFAALARAIGVSALVLLLLDPTIRAGGPQRRPLVLLDNSVSMHATGGRAAEAAALAASIGDTTAFGELAPGLPGDRSALFDVLTGAVTSGRAVTVVTDGEIPDVATIPADLLAQVSIRALPRPTGPDIALTAVRAPLRLAAGDTLAMTVEATRTPGAPDSIEIVVHDSALVLMHGTLHFGASHRAEVHLSAALPHGYSGERWLQVTRVGAADAEPGDDVRWWRLTVTPTPGIAVLAVLPDFDARALYRSLVDVANVPVRGFVQLQAGSWRRMEDLSPVTSEVVANAARHADLLAVRGDPGPWKAAGRARLFWLPADQPGDWYVGGANNSPIADAFAGVDADSLPPFVAIHPIAVDSTGGWIGATARRSRRGTPIPVIGGREDHDSRTVTIAADGLYRWSLRGGVADQAWRTMVSEMVSWLLAAPESDSARARPIDPVTERGRAVRFRWIGRGAPLPLAIALTGPRGASGDTLRFDAAGDATLPLDVGRYRYTLGGGGAGTFAVEPYADELVPSPVTLRSRPASLRPGGPGRPLRDLVWLFAVAIAGFGAEWMLRRRMGLR
jgi:hypothetical protein